MDAPYALEWAERNPPVPVAEHQIPLFPEQDTERTP